MILSAFLLRPNGVGSYFSLSVAAASLMLATSFFAPGAGITLCSTSYAASVKPN